MDVLQNPKYSYLAGKQAFYFKIFKVLFYYYSRIVFTLYAPLKVFGRENLPDKSFIFCSNHNSHMDVAVLAASAKKNFNHFGMLAARDYWFDSWIKRTLVNTVMNLVPVDRKSSKIRKLSIDDTIRRCRSFMDYGQRSLIMFPEGTRGEPGKILPFKKGAATFSIKLDKPILPAVIYGSHKIWPRGKIFFGLPTKIHVYILDPIYPSSFLERANPSEEEVGEAIEKITLQLEKQIKEKASLLYE